MNRGPSWPFTIYELRASVAEQSLGRVSFLEAGNY